MSYILTIQVDIFILQGRLHGGGVDAAVVQAGKNYLACLVHVFVKIHENIFNTTEKMLFSL